MFFGLLLSGSIACTHLCATVKTKKLSKNLIVEEEKRLNVKSNLTIDGQEQHNIQWEKGSQIVVYPQSTLTLKNVTLKANFSTENNPCITLSDKSSTLILDNVTFKLRSDFYFFTGNLIINNTVSVAGNNRFIYKSYNPCTIKTNSKMIFEKGTTFFYAPTQVNENLIKMENQSSTLKFCNANLTIAQKQKLRLTNGTLVVQGELVICGNMPNLNPPLGTEDNLTVLLEPQSKIIIFTGVTHAHYKRSDFSA
jgi:hypothetical protein